MRMMRLKTPEFNLSASLSRWWDVHCCERGGDTRHPHGSAHFNSAIKIITDILLTNWFFDTVFLKG